MRGPLWFRLPDDDLLPTNDSIRSIRVSILAMGGYAPALMVDAIRWR